MSQQQRAALGATPPIFTPRSTLGTLLRAAFIYDYRVLAPRSLPPATFLPPVPLPPSLPSRTKEPRGTGRPCNDSVKAHRSFHGTRCERETSTRKRSSPLEEENTQPLDEDGRQAPTKKKKQYQNPHARPLKNTHSNQPNCVSAAAFYRLLYGWLRRTKIALMLCLNDNADGETKKMNNNNSK